MAVCLLIVTTAPVVLVIGFETVGHHRAERAVAGVLASGMVVGMVVNDRSVPRSNEGGPDE
ncbi:hypothetical protein B1R94_07460 [Mycolicibacterium litorale]|nr:hypothetical protein B1R94_07460 [Mycolicibacterium litorale]